MIAQALSLIRKDAPAFLERHAVVLLTLVLVYLLIAFGERMINAPHQAFAVAAVVVFVIVLLLDVRMAMYLFIAGLILYEEFSLSSTEAFFDTPVEDTIVGLRFFGVSLMDAVTLLFLVPVLLKEWMHWYEEAKWRWLPLDTLFLPFICVYFWGAGLGVFNAASFSDYTWELRDPFYILSWYFVASRTLRSRQQVLMSLAVIVGMFSIKSLFFLFRSLAGQGLFYGSDFYRPALGSDVPMMAILFTVSIAASLLLHGGVRWKQVLLYLLVGYWSIWFISSIGRASYIGGVGSAVVVLMIMRKDLKWTHVAWILGISALGGLFFYYVILTDTHRELVGYVINTAFNWIDALAVHGDRSMGQRVLEFVNISEILTRQNAWLFGLGWGAPWSEIVMKMPYDTSSFSFQEWARGVHTAAHLDVVYFLLKVGIVGTLIIYATYIYAMVLCVRMFRVEHDPLIRWACLFLLVALIIIVPNYTYFTKLKFLLGMVIASLGTLIHARQTESQGA